MYQEENSVQERKLSRSLTDEPYSDTVSSTGSRPAVGCLTSLSASQYKPLYKWINNQIMYLMDPEMWSEDVVLLETIDFNSTILQR